jgi:hypothetical protein
MDPGWLASRLELIKVEYSIGDHRLARKVKEDNYFALIIFLRLFSHGCQGCSNI